MHIILAAEACRFMSGDTCLPQSILKNTLCPRTPGVGTEGYSLLRHAPSLPAAPMWGHDHTMDKKKAQVSTLPPKPLGLSFFLCKMKGLVYHLAISSVVQRPGLYQDIPRKLFRNADFPALPQNCHAQCCTFNKISR